MKTLEIQVIGKVQGVYYRATAREKARELDLVGYVQNRENGSVYIIVSGDNTILENFLDWCRIGPPSAIVDELIVKELPPQSFSVFEIRY